MPTSRYLSKGNKNLTQKDICTTMFTEALFIIAKTWTQPECPLKDEWIKKMGWIYTMGYLFSHNKGNPTWKDLEGNMLS